MTQRVTHASLAPQLESTRVGWEQQNKIKYYLLLIMYNINYKLINLVSILLLLRTQRVTHASLAPCLKAIGLDAKQGSQKTSSR